MKKPTWGRRLLALFATLAMLMSSMPNIALAEDGIGPESMEVIQQIVTDDLQNASEQEDAGSETLVDKTISQDDERQSSEDEQTETVNDDELATSDVDNAKDEEIEEAQVKDDENNTEEVFKQPEEKVDEGNEDFIIPPDIQPGETDTNAPKTEAHYGTVISDTEFHLNAPKTNGNKANLVRSVTIKAAADGASLLGASIISAKASENITIVSGQVTEITFTNKKEPQPGNQPGKIVVTKVDASTNAKLSGAVFELLKNNAVISTKTTGTDGTCTFENLEAGEYVVREKSAPSGYKLSVTPNKTVTVAAGGTASVTFENDKELGGLKIVKTDADDGKKLEGAVFTVTNSSGKVVATITTNANGEGYATELEPGEYTVTETKAPANYAIVTVSKKATVTVNKDTTVEFTNKKLTGKVTIAKKDTNTGHRLEGAEFELRRKDNGVLFGKAISNNDGIAIWNNVPYGTYVITETVAPPRYRRWEGTKEVTVGATTVEQTIEMENTQLHGSLKVKKTGENNAPLAGAKFAVYTDKDASKRAVSITGEVLPVATTNASGIAVWDNVPTGQYYVREESAPDGYELDTSFHGPAIVADRDPAHPTADVEYNLLISNNPILGEISIHKTSEKDSKPVVGAVFAVIDKATNKEVDRITTDSNGSAHTKELHKGEYIVREVSAPEDYYINETDFTATIATQKQIVQLNITDKPKPGKISVTKTNSLDNTPIAGVEFEILNAAGQVVATIKTGADGKAVSGDLDIGAYKVREKNNPTGYVKDAVVKDAIVVSLKTTNIAVTNRPVQGKIRILKVDELTNKPLQGAEFTVKRLSGLPSHNGEGNGKVVATITSNAEGIAETGVLTYGEYEIVESKVPAHYNKKTSTAIGTVKIDGSTTEVKTVEVTAKNYPNPGKIKILKISDNMPLDYYLMDHAENIKKYPIPGVTFDIYKGTTIVDTIVTDRNGEATTKDLDPGTYIVKERALPEGYTGILAEQGDVIVRSDETTELEFVNKLIQGRVKIKKVDSLTKEPLAGAKFVIGTIVEANDGSGRREISPVLDTIVTDANGEATSKLLPYGEYGIMEAEIPEHYSEEVGRYWHKRGDNPLNSNGQTLNSEEEGYDRIVKEFKLDENEKTYEFEVENKPNPGKIQITKTDRENGNPIEGVQFDIYYNDEYGTGLAGTMTTGKDGIAVSEPIRKGKYLVKEHGATDGYVFETIELDATVHSDEVTELTATNQPVKVKLTIYKRDWCKFMRDEDWRYTEGANGEFDISYSRSYAWKPVTEKPETFGDAKLTGAKFKLVAYEDITDRQGNILYKAGDTVIDSLIAEGELASVTTKELWPGKYAFEEIEAPVGYKLYRNKDDNGRVIVDATDAAKQSVEAVVTYDGVRTNHVKTGRFALVKFLGDNLTHSDPGLIEHPEENAKFEIYMKSAGSYKKAKEYERDIVVTDKCGYAVTKELPYGIYTVRQIEGKDGFAIKSPFNIKIDGTEDQANPPKTIVNNEAIRYRLRLIKTDEETKKVILCSNVSFKLKDDKGNFVKQVAYYPNRQEIDTFTTDETGMVTLPETVVQGVYYIVEMKAPEGYLIRTEELEVYVGGVNGERNAENAYELDIEIPNKPVKGYILLDKLGEQLVGFEQKTDKHGNKYQQPVYENKYLAGAKFEVRAAEDIVGKDGTVHNKKDELVDTIVTTNKGADSTKELYLGKYYLVEKEAPEGYIFQQDRYDTEVVYLNDATAKVFTKVEAGNDYLPIELSLKKEKQITTINHNDDGTIHQVITKVPGADFVFGLFNATDIRYEGGSMPADTLLATAVTDEAGNLTFAGMYPHGKYYVKELSTQDGWRLNTTKYKVTLDSSMLVEGTDVIRVQLPTTVLNELIYKNIELTKTDITGEKTIPGALIEVRNEKGEIIYREYTDQDGKIKNIPVTPGKYTFKEILAPEGYALNVAEMSFTVDENLNVTGDDTIVDDYTRVILAKMDPDGEPVEGAKFALRKEDGTQVFTAVSDKDGKVVFEKIPYGDFVIVEETPAPGYIPNGTKVKLSVNGTFINVDGPSATLVNKPIDVIISKVDNKGAALSGATFGLFDKDNKQIMTAVSNEKGIVKFSKVHYGDYTIREIGAPDGYLLSRTVTEVSVDENYRNQAEPLATIINQPKRIKYIKVDTAGKYLEGVEFTLYNAETEEGVEIVTSNEKGEFIFTKFDYGDWIIRETVVPEGYNKMDDITIHVDENWVEPAPFTCVNIPNHYEFVKTDNKGNPLPGVKFTLEDEEGNILGEYVSDENGIVTVTDLKPGTYIIRELEGVPGFRKTEDVIRVIVDEHYVVPEEMFTLINYPDIKTGVEFTMSPLMIGGILLVCAAAILAILFGFNKIGPKKGAKTAENADKQEAEKADAEKEEHKEEAENKAEEQKEEKAAEEEPEKTNE